ncbi:MAG: class I SAM-dependent methyltransferase [Deltaproteobacteria bacterium]|nr:class I SAM-dependent methyltransferase [Deltaproteobacteria bacterium]
MEQSFFNKLVWLKDRILFEDLVFRLEHFKTDDWELGEECFNFYKIKPLIDQYSKFWFLKKKFHIKNIMELGLWEGGSTVFWFECFRPQKIVGIDIAEIKKSDYFQSYITSRGLEERIKHYWGTDQANSERLKEIFKNEFDTPLDLVIDDASHMYELTKSSFETLFPMLRPGGIYIIEDWAWAHWKDIQMPENPWMTNTGLTRLVFELVELTGSTNNEIISALTIFQGFIAIERAEMGTKNLDKDFKIEEHIYRRAGDVQKAKDEQIKKLEKTLTDIDICLRNTKSLLAEKEVTLSNIYKSRGWRVLRIYYKLKEKILRKWLSGVS